MDGVTALILGALGAVVLTPVFRRLALSFGIVDRPGALKTHRRPVPYLGGVAVTLAAAVGPILGGCPLVLIPIGLALLLGLTDDIRPLPVSGRVMVEIVIAVLAAIVVTGPLPARVATAVLALGLLNAVNLLDGQDGLVAGVAAISAAGFAVFGGGATPTGLALAGALAGFLIWNRPPARIYLGDAGAYAVGTTLAVLPALTADSSTSWSLWWAVPLLVGVPVVDTALAIGRRLRQRRPLFQGDRSHVYDQLVDRGCSVTASTLIGWTAQLVATLAGIGVARLDPAAAFGATVAAGLLIAAGAWRGGLVSR